MTTNNNALIGYSGFVGSVLSRQTEFKGRYRSTNISSIGDTAWDTVVCAAAPAAKWIANRDPGADLANIEGLIGNLRHTRCRQFVLISTVDVFASPLGVDENSRVEEGGLHAYGLHRRRLEKFVEEHFERSLVVRLPGLVGPGLRKNVVYDFLNTNNLHSIDSRGVFQFYPMINLWYDLRIAIEAGLTLVHLTAEAVSVADVAKEGFGMSFEQHLEKSPARYDLKSLYASLFGGSNAYQYSSRESIQAIRAYAQTEPPSRPS